MINFRYHLVSLVAVFLALAIGIVVGSTVVDRAIVDTLRSRIDEVEAKADARRAESDRLRSDVAHLDAYIDGSAPYALEGRLIGVPVVVAARRGADDGAVTAAVARLRQAGARAPVVVWLEPAWDLIDADDVARLAAALETQGAPERLRQVALERLALDLGSTDPGHGTLRTLEEAGFLGVEGVSGGDPSDLGAWPGPGYRALVVGETPGVDEGAPVVTDLVEALARAEIPTTLGEVPTTRSDEARRGALTALVVDDPDLAPVVSTVDTLDRVEGRVAAALALDDLGRGAVGHYGAGKGAQAPLPAWPGP